MQAGVPEPCVATINMMCALAHERESFRATAIDLMHAGLPSHFVAEACDLAQLDRRTCLMADKHPAPRCRVRITTGNTWVSVAVRADTSVVFEFHVTHFALRCGNWRAEHKGPLKRMCGPTSRVLLRMLSAAERFLSEMPRGSRVIRDIAEYIRDARDPLPSWWTALPCLKDGVIIASASNHEVVTLGDRECVECMQRAMGSGRK